MSEVTKIKNQEDDISLDDIKKYLLDMLIEFANFCGENHLCYYLSGGTLLGAVRHQGFIPWDDDVDLMMPREDYERFIRSFSDNRFCLSSCELDSDYNTPFARLWDTTTVLHWNTVNEKEIGVFIDIFPIDGFPTGEIKTKWHLLRLKLLRTKINASNRKEFADGEKYHLLKIFLAKLLTKNGNYYARKLNAVAKKYSYTDSCYVGVKTTTEHLFREKNDKKIFDETIYLPFEGLKLPAPSGYDSYLKKLYGDYMQLPPEDKRYSAHQFQIEFCDSSNVQGGVNLPQPFDLTSYLYIGRCA